MDVRFEFDAPRFYDFQAMLATNCSPGTAHDTWFATQGPSGLATPQAVLADIDAAAGRVAAEVRAETERGLTAVSGEPHTQPLDPKVDEALVSLQSADKPMLQPNIVTSWAHRDTAGRQEAASAPVNPVAKPAADQDANSKAARQASMGKRKRADIEQKSSMQDGLALQPTGTTASGHGQGGASLLIEQHFAAPLTQPREPRLATSKRQRTQPPTEVAAGEWKSLAQRVAEFHQNEKPPQRSCIFTERGAPSAPTLAQAPSFATDGRMRGSRFMSQEETEAEAIAAHPPFQARPFDLGLGQSCGGAQAVQPKPPTEAQSPALRTKTRSGLRLPPAVPAAREFHAQPLDRRILAGPAWQPQPSEQVLTVSQAPNLTTTARALQAEAAKGASADDMGADQDREMDGKHEAFRALGFVPETNARRQLLPPLAMPLLTEPQPFSLASQQRHEQARSQHQDRLEAEAQAAREHAQFKAQPLPQPGPVFVPQPSDKELTAALDFPSASATRSMHRAQFNDEVAHKQQLLEAAKKQEAERLAEEEAAAVKALRKTMVFKATKAPAPSSSKPAKKAPAPKRVCRPRSPKLKTRLRSRTRR
ncbi:hypothetical protein WJX73_007210 [Symbiochloris irregularis]|uniref:TPX2 C-terminal domain-containing protein n=1 Tax=Symbiochloris irregularis TaxID=706552 RepID=A0AAW1PML6_9CHLO